jgi:hypothetical protein
MASIGTHGRSPTRCKRRRFLRRPCRNGLASTLTHGAGVICPAWRVMTYSWPSLVKPPKPLRKISSRGGYLLGRSWPRGAGGRQRRDQAAPARSGAPAAPPRDPFSSSRTIRATDCSSTRSSLGDLLAAPDEDAARLVLHLRLDPRGDQIGDLVVQGLPVDRDVLVQDDQLGRQPLHAPVGVRLDQLPDDLDLLRVADVEQDDRRVARNAVAPKAALAAPVAAQHAGPPAGRVGVDQGAGQPAVELGLSLGRVEMAQGHLAVGPRQIKGAVGHAGALVFLRQRERGLPAFRTPSRQVDDGGLTGRQGDRAPKRDDRIEDRADGVGQRELPASRRVGQGPPRPMNRVRSVSHETSPCSPPWPP